MVIDVLKCNVAVRKEVLKKITITLENAHNIILREKSKRLGYY